MVTGWLAEWLTDLMYSLTFRIRNLSSLFIDFQIHIFKFSKSKIQNNEHYGNRSNQIQSIIHIAFVRSTTDKSEWKTYTLGVGRQISNYDLKFSMRGDFSLSRGSTVHVQIHIEFSESSVSCGNSSFSSSTSLLSLYT